MPERRLFILGWAIRPDFDKHQQPVCSELCPSIFNVTGTGEAQCDELEGFVKIGGDCMPAFYDLAETVAFTDPEGYQLPGQDSPWAHRPGSRRKG